MWALPEADLHLSFENNDFVKVDPKKLNPICRKILWLSIIHGVLDVEKGEELEVLVASREEPKPADELSVIEKGRKAIDLVERAGKLKELLKNNVATIRRELPQISNPRDLQVLSNLERNGKKRKTVLKFIGELEERLNEKFGKEVAASVSQESRGVSSGQFSDNQLFRGQQKALLENMGDVIESEERDITIQIGDQDSS